MVLESWNAHMWLYGHPSAADDESDVEDKKLTVLGAIIRLVGGLACLVFGSNAFVGAATNVAASLGISDAVIGLTIVAGGTSLPELATSVVAARKGQSAIAMGNVIGSCVYNILLIINCLNFAIIFCFSTIK